jgi:hypothetical protein
MPLASRLLRSFLVALLASLALASTAGAAITTSEITSLTDGQVLLTTGNGETVTVSGNSDGTTGDQIKLVCVEGPHGTVARFLGYVAPLDADGTFSLEVEIDRIYGTCLLHAVPAGAADWVSGDPLTGFQGVRVVSEHRVLYQVSSGPNAGVLYDYFFAHQGASAYSDYLSVSSCGLCDTRLTYPGSPPNSEYLFWGNAALYGGDEGRGRTYAQIGGHSAYGAEAAREINEGAGNLPALTYSPSVDLAGNATITESQTFVRCPTDAVSPSAAACPSFISTGVRLDRKIAESDGGTLITVVDDWVNTTGEPQRLDLHYDQYFQQSGGAPGFEFPWIGGGYATVAPSTSVPVPPSAPATIFVKNNNSAADGSIAEPQGTITFSPAPDEIFFHAASEFVLGFDRVVPPGGTERIVQVFGIGTHRADLAARAAQVEASLRRPAPQPQPQPSTPAAKKASKLKLGLGKRVRVRKGRVAIGGTIAKTATKRVRVAMRCGKTKLAKSAKPRNGRWKATLKLRGRCKTAKKAALTVSYAGDATLKKARVKRKVTLVRPKRG